MDKDYISLNVGKSNSRKQKQNDIYQDYIDNIDEEYKQDLNRFVALSLDENPSFDSSSSEAESIISLKEIESKTSKSQIKKAKREAKRLRKEIAIEDSLNVHDDALELAKILKKSKGFLDKGVIEYLYDYLIIIV